MYSREDAMSEDWKSIDRFSPKVCERLGWYVYLFIDPRDGKPFYVGKGKANRCFAHLKVRRLCAKTERIGELRKLGKVPRIEILKYGLTEAEAFLVESAAIELLGFDLLTNEVRGHHALDRAKAGVVEIEEELSAMPVEVRHKVILITINKLYRPGMPLPDLYDATRSAWKVNPELHQPEYAFSVYRGIVRAAFEITRWLPAGSTLKTYEHDGYRPEGPRAGRWEFVGLRAPDTVWRRYVGKSVRKYIVQGAQNPIQYVGC
jgi:hypothetical protein